MIIGKGLYLKKYQIYSPKLPLSFDGFRFIFISDLHGKVYGKENASLIKLIDKVNPDCILIGGDMVVGGESRKYNEGYTPISGKSVYTSIDLLSKLSKKYAIIHALGNHEEKLHHKLWEVYKEALTKLNVKLLDNDVYRLTRENEESIDIYGLSLGREFYPKFKRQKLPLENMIDTLGIKNENYSILMAHSPLYFETYKGWGADLTLSGHLHGGIMRLPLLGGVIGPDFFIFPKYSGGLYKEGGKNMIVSCGAGMHTINLRIFNPPELTLVELKFGEKINGN
ncbi:MAG: metallophosphoesterase [Catonella sp.]|uniref:metallophosphoesterase n=1 Tax=Catonella sp. TaxID=2382125 RepID=UPI003F9F17DF